jgi:anti-sigma regulatory factor (Ser/Thr protein kinase)
LPSASRRLPSSARASAAARALVRELADGRLPGSVVDDAALLTSELVTNAVRHAGDDPIDLRVAIDDSTLTVVVRDRGPSFDPDAAVRTETGGWGLSIVEELSTEWGVVSNGGGNEVWFEIRETSRPHQR